MATSPPVRTGVFVINLERSDIRRQRVLRGLAKVGVEATVWKAVDGASLDVATAPRYDQARRLARFGHDLTPNEIACALSHLACIEAALAEGFDKICILEDDVIVAPDFKAVLDACFALPAGADMVKLYGLRRRPSRPVAELTPTRTLVRPLHATCGAQGYVLDRVGMKKALAACTPLIMQIDIALDRYWANGLALFAVLPSPLIEPQDLPSDINAPRVDPWRAVPHRWLRLRLKMHKLLDSVRRHGVNLARGLRRGPVR
ncbi:glycosyltransferase family 25 protein [Pararhodospirillum oryzae]|uniref:Glycosyl transferase n=1 Tax=Pararhodospirillum oryzae TaxID=478448 RepID=A0A512HAV0_9PROT|nr:glycosyltransferase family 25 protein [Pararhodospirillum oryzae]GEO82586.1 glycosyl transferase [Pararhodospirillum oryzae]